MSAEKTCLVIGCGAEDSKRNDVSDEGVIALDVDRSTAKSFKTKHPYITTVVADACSLPFKKDVFELVEATHVLEHLPPDDTQMAVNEAARVSKKHAKIIFSTPATLFEKIISIINIKHHSEEMHQQVVNRKQLTNLVKKSELKIEKCKPQRFDHALKQIAIAIIHRFKPNTIGFNAQTGFKLESESNAVFMARKSLKLLFNCIRILNPIMNNVLPYETEVTARKK